MKKKISKRDRARIARKRVVLVTKTVSKNGRRQVFLAGKI